MDSRLHPLSLGIEPVLQRRSWASLSPEFWAEPVLGLGGERRWSLARSCSKSMLSMLFSIYPWVSYRSIMMELLIGRCECGRRFSIDLYRRFGREGAIKA